jgi:3-oxoadipate enol-lactonase
MLSNSLATTSGMWDPQMARLLRRYRVVRYDHRGHGSSPRVEGAVAMGDLARDVVAILDRLDVEHASFCGLSLGGMIGLQVAADFPERIDRLVVCSTSAHLDAASFWRDRAETARRHGLEPVADVIVGRWFTSTFARVHADIVTDARAMIVSTDPRSYARYAELLADLDLRASLGRIRAPTLVVMGDQDEAIPPDHGESIAASVATASSVRLEGAAHLLTLEGPSAFGDLLMRHLGGLT